MGLLRVKKKWEERNKHRTLKLIDCPLYNILADMSYIVITETRETILLFILKNIDQVFELSN